MSMKSILDDAILDTPGLAQMAEAKKAADKAKLDMFQFVARGKTETHLRVLRFSGEERANEPYEIDVELLAPNDIDPLTTLEDALLGHPASLVMADVRDVPRPIHGIITSYEVTGSLDRESVRIRVRLSARLMLLKLRVHSRIFQNETVPAILEKVLREWRVPHRFELSGSYTPRTFCTQYHESDFDFFRRLLAREGIFFYFRQSSEHDVEELVLTDDAMYRGLPGQRGKLSMRSGRFEVDDGDVVELGVRRKIRPTAARLGDFDYRHPNLPLRSIELLEDPKGFAGDLGAERMGTYLFGHEAEHEATASAAKRDQDASRLLAALRSDGLTVVGSSRSRKLVPGHSFALEGHTLDGLNREWVVVAVVHEGRTPEFGGTEAEEVYYNEFEAAPVETALRLPPETRRRVQHGNQTATVVGAADGEVFTDTDGRVKVQFHWDLDGKSDEHASAWIRVAQAWAGPGFGAQFLPRVGTEVVITFLDGDPDRPLIIGAVYNGTHPPPFGLPAQRAKSGFRTQSTPGGEGGSELSFNDEAGEEGILLKAQRKLDIEVGQDQSVSVAGSATMKVEGQLTENVSGTQTTTVSGGQTTLVAVHKTTQVLGDWMDTVRGTADRRVSGDDNVRVEGVARSDIAQVDSFVRSDATHRVRGHMTAVVGEDQKPTSATLHVEGTIAGYASRTTEIIAEKGIVLRCGESSLRIGPDRVEILSPNITFSGKQIEAGAEERVTMVSKDGILMKANRLHAMGKSSSLFLFKDADIGGDRVKLNCIVDEAAVVASGKPLTRIKLVDQDGKPARRRRYVIVDGKSERSGVLNDEGEAEIELDHSAQIYFPDVDKPREA